MFKQHLKFISAKITSTKTAACPYWLLTSLSRQNANQSVTTGMKTGKGWKFADLVLETGDGVSLTTEMLNALRLGVHPGSYAALCHSVECVQRIA
jgi:hypothetical protein